MTDKHELIALAALASLALAGCSPEQIRAFNEQQRQKAAEEAEAIEPNIWTDPQTSCRYYVWKEGYGRGGVGGLSIRFNADGTPDCPRAERERQQ